MLLYKKVAIFAEKTSKLSFEDFVQLEEDLEAHLECFVFFVRHFEASMEIAVKDIDGSDQVFSIKYFILFSLMMDAKDQLLQL